MLLTDEKKANNKELSKDILSCTRVNVTKHATLKENLVAIFPTTTFRRLLYGHLQKVELLNSNITMIVLIRKVMFLMKRK